MDYWGEMPFYQLDLWELKTAFAGVFTASRVTQAAFRTAFVPAHILCDSVLPGLTGSTCCTQSSIPMCLPPNSSGCGLQG